MVCPRAAFKINIAIGTDAVGSLISLGLGSDSIWSFWAWEGWSVLVSFAPHPTAFSGRDASLDPVDCPLRITSLFFHQAGHLGSASEVIWSFVALLVSRIVPRWSFEIHIGVRAL